MQRTTTALALADNGDAPAPVAEQSKALANSEAQIWERMTKMADEAEAYFDKWKATDDHRQGEAAFKVMERCLRLYAELKGMFPKPATTIVDNRSVTLNGLSTDELKALATQLAAGQQ
jgi:hypothetical protein